MGNIQEPLRRFLRSSIYTQRPMSEPKNLMTFIFALVDNQRYNEG